MSEISQAVTQEDPGVVAQRLAREKALENAAARKKAREKLEGGAKAAKDAQTGLVTLSDGRKVRPWAAFKDTKVGDFTHVDPKFVKKDDDGDFCVRWIRHLDNAGNPSTAEMDRMAQFGFEVVRGADGKPLVRDELTAMQAPAGCLAAYLVACARPGSMILEEAADNLRDVIKDVNRKAGRRVVEFITDDQDGVEDPWGSS